jgi:hypothetical protein
MHYSRWTVLARASLLVGVFTMTSCQSTFVPLMDGETLNGWEQNGGRATYAVEDGAIVGRSVPLTPNSFLCTKKHYSDFILEYEFQCDDELNSGVQIRSNSLPEYRNGLVHGYQVEIDPDKPERMWAGGIYDESRRGWLYPGKGGGDAEKFSAQGIRIYKKGAWNKVRVEAIGASIKTWLNGELRADLQDDMTSSGFICLQVHGAGWTHTPQAVRWRNLRIQEVQTD